MTKKQPDSARIIWVEAFVALIDTGSYKAAASKGISATTVQRRIAQLESWLHKILVTSDVPVDITEDGILFGPIADEIMGLVDAADLKDSLSTVRVQPDGSVMVDGVEYRTDATVKIGELMTGFRAKIDENHRAPARVSGKDIDMDAFFAGLKS